jgi:uncharacterized Zn finger protein (UPF0148 family)
VSALMGQRLLSGWTMRSESCEACAMPLMSLRDGPWECLQCGVVQQPGEEPGETPGMPVPVPAGSCGSACAFP